MLLLGPLSGMLAAKLAKLRREILQWTERRVGYMSEIIQGIQMIKFYAWEAPFAEKVQGARAQEKRILKITAFWQVGGWVGGPSLQGSVGGGQG
jgi:ATP-binding cassette subfamily C (CFTR/MRP) protein 1